MSFTTELQGIKENLERVVTEMHGCLYRLDQAIKRQDLDDTEKVDVGFLCREFENELDEMRKEVKARKETIGRLIALIVTRESLENPERARGNMRGSLAIAVPDVQMRPRMPKKGTPEWKQLCRTFGLSEEAIEAELFSPHWVHFSEHLTDLAAKGEPIPDGLLGTEPQPQCTFRRRKQR